MVRKFIKNCVAFKFQHRIFWFFYLLQVGKNLFKPYTTVSFFSKLSNFQKETFIFTMDATLLYELKRLVQPIATFLTINNFWKFTHKFLWRSLFINYTFMNFLDKWPQFIFIYFCRNFWVYTFPIYILI